MKKPANTLGLRHVALFVSNLEQCLSFYTELLGMEIEWQPDADNVYLTGGSDNLALHRWHGEAFDKTQKLDHIGFILKTEADVDDWHAYLAAKNVVIKKAPKTHRDGARSFYCLDPAGTLVQMIFHPPISDML
jgi:catechol 2,3-dioxygenase-like lactoylglutathione lyase family enzyme